MSDSQLVRVLALVATALGANSAAAQDSPQSISFLVSRFDFLASHPDFEGGDFGLVTGAVAPTLSEAGVPTLLEPPAGTFSTAANFAQWYAPIDGVNQHDVEVKVLTPSANDPTLFVYEDTSYFPIDGKLLGNEGDTYLDNAGVPHNFHFTTHMSGTFNFDDPADMFEFEGDDDVWAFFDNKLMIDLGGVHTPERAQITGQDLINSGLAMNTDYRLDVFHAERHTTGSNFMMQTHFSIKPRHTPATIDFITNPDTQITAMPPQRTDGPAVIGITWSDMNCGQGEALDLDLFVNQIGATDGWIAWSGTHESGTFHGDIKQAGGGVESMNLHFVPNLRDIDIRIARFRGSCTGPVEGHVRASHDGKVYQQSFSIPAGTGARDKDPNNPSSENWAIISGADLFKLN